MKDEGSSRTAEYMAFFRALESVRPAHRRLFVDPLATCFLPATLRRAVSFSRIPLGSAVVNGYADHRLPGARTSAIARTRLIDDLLLAALNDHIRQVVILGAGFDSRPYRLPQLTAATVYEVDHPATLRKKLACLRPTLLETPSHVHFVEIDFNHQSLPELLDQAGLQRCQAAVFLWEGVTNYLTPEAVDSVLQYVASFAPGSRLVLTYVHSGVLDGSASFYGAQRLLREVAQLGEPWTFGLDPGEVLGFFAKRGLCLDSDLSAAEYRARYFAAEAQQMKGYEFYHVATVHVPREKPLSPEKPF